MNRTDLAGYVGLALVQFNCVPAIIQAIQTGVSAPLSSMLLMIAGLSCYLYNSIKTGNTLYTVGNLIGLIGNVVLFVAVLFKG